MLHFRVFSLKKPQGHLMVGNYHKIHHGSEFPQFGNPHTDLTTLLRQYRHLCAVVHLHNLCIFVQCMCILNILSMLCILYTPLLGLGRITHPTRTRYYRSTLKSVVFRRPLAWPWMALSGPAGPAWHPSTGQGLGADMRKGAV